MNVLCLTFGLSAASSLYMVGLKTYYHKCLILAGTAFLSVAIMVF